MATVICMGELLWDCVAHEIGVSYESVTQWHRQLGGAPANVAFGLQQLGLTAALISCVGQDEAGQTLLKHCQERGIDSRGIQHHHNLSTRHVDVLRLGNGDRVFAGFGQLPPADFADRHIQAQQLPKSLFEAADYLVIGTVAWAATESRAAITQALDFADEFNVKVFLDVNWRPMFWDDPAAAPMLIRELWPRIDFLKLSTEEAQLLFNTTNAGAIATQIDSIEGVWVTAGSQEPISYYLSGNTGQVQPLEIEAIDTTGAGDSFVAGLIAQLCQRGLASASQPDVAQAITTYGAAAGALSTRQIGAIAAQPTVKDVTAFLAAHGRA